MTVEVTCVEFVSSESGFLRNDKKDHNELKCPIIILCLDLNLPRLQNYALTIDNAKEMAFETLKEISSSGDKECLDVYNFWNEIKQK